MAFGLGRLPVVAAETGWRHLGKVIEDEVPRRLRMTWVEFARHSGLSVRTVFDLRKAVKTRYEPGVLGRLEAGMGWEPHSVDNVLKGREPDRIPNPARARLDNVWDLLTPEAQTMLADLAERSAGR